MCPLPEMIALFTDFGIGSHYIGQVKARLLSLGVHQPIIELCSDAPPFNPRAAAYLLASFRKTLPVRTLYLAVVDPGVGTSRKVMVAQDGERLYMAPDNGLLSQVARCSSHFRAQSIDLDPPGRSRTFDGRDLFAPVAAMIARGEAVPGEPVSQIHMVGHDWPDRLSEVIYIDHYGNAVTGLPSDGIGLRGWLSVNGWRIGPAGTFAEMATGAPFWYVNSNGLLEIAVNQGSAADQLQVAIGTPLTIHST